MQVIIEVFYVPDLKDNSLSIEQLQEKGLAILIKKGRCRIYHPGRGLIVETSMTSNRMFTLLVQSLPKEQSYFNAITEDPARTWYCQYGHLSYRGLKTVQENMVQGLSILKAPSKVCGGCLIGKQQRDPFLKESTWRASQILQLVHADICGPITPISKRKKRYFISFIDDKEYVRRQKRKGKDKGYVRRHIHPRIFFFFYQ